MDKSKYPLAGVRVTVKDIYFRELISVYFSCERLSRKGYLQSTELRLPVVTALSTRPTPLVTPLVRPSLVLCLLVPTSSGRPRPFNSQTVTVPLLIGLTTTLLSSSVAMDTESRPVHRLVLVLAPPPMTGLTSVLALTPEGPSVDPLVPTVFTVSGPQSVPSASTTSCLSAIFLTLEDLFV